MSRIYCTKAIRSFEVTKDKLFITLVYIPYQRAAKDTWWGGSKMVMIDSCWLDERHVSIRNNTALPKKLEALDYSIKEENTVYDFSKVKDKLIDSSVEKMDRENGYTIENSNFEKWFNKNFNDDFYYETITDVLGYVKKINIYEKGSIYIYFDDEYDFILTHKHIPDAVVQTRVLKEVGNGISEYDFLRKDDDGFFVFLSLDEDNTMKYII